MGRKKLSKENFLPAAPLRQCRRWDRASRLSSASSPHCSHTPGWCRAESTAARIVWASSRLFPTSIKTRSYWRSGTCKLPLEAPRFQKGVSAHANLQASIIRPKYLAHKPSCTTNSCLQTPTLPVQLQERENRMVFWKPTLKMLLDEHV